MKGAKNSGGHCYFSTSPRQMMEVCSSAALINKAIELLLTEAPTAV